MCAGARPLNQVRKQLTMRSRSFVGAILLALLPTTHAQMQAPLRESVNVVDYYPPVGFRRNVMARVVLKFRPSEYGLGVKPASITVEDIQLIPRIVDASKYPDWAVSALLPRSEDVASGQMQERFVASAEKLVETLRFKEPATFPREQRISILYLFEPCDQLTHGSTVDYFITICTKPYEPQWID